MIAEGEARAVLSLLPPDFVQQHGLPGEAVLGDVIPDQPEMSADQFTPNEAFLLALHAIVQAYGPELPSVQKQLQAVRNGAVYVVDRRSARAGQRPPFQDVIGWFGVREGILQPESYNANPNYRLMGDAGPPQPEADLAGIVLREMMALATRAGPDPAG
jgi:hypothetical protein